MSLDFVRIESDVACPSPAVLYDRLRGFEAHFKTVCCSETSQSCAGCANVAGCPYQIVFAQNLSPDPDVVRTHQKPSLPFSLYVDMLRDDNSCCTVGMVIIGSALNYVDIFLAALRQFIQACRAGVGVSRPHVPQFYTLDYQGCRHFISEADSLSESMILLSGHHILQNTVHSDHVRLVLKSPVRLVHNGVNMHHFDFAVFFRSQLRRCSSLYAYYGTGELSLDYSELSQAAQNVAVLEDEILYTRPSWSPRHGKAGLLGSVECGGLSESMYSLLLLGSYFNAGKGAAFGSGYYTVEVL